MRNNLFFMMVLSAILYLLVPCLVGYIVAKYSLSEETITEEKIILNAEKYVIEDNEMFFCMRQTHREGIKTNE